MPILSDLRNNLYQSYIALRTLCQNYWYRGRVSTLTYDSGLKRFRHKAPGEVSKEYQVAYQDFLNYKSKKKRRYR